MAFTPIQKIGEFGLIDRIHETLGDVAQREGLLHGIGDDSAVLDAGNGRSQVVSTDLLIEGVHFDRTFMPLRYLGWKAVSVNVSDIVAMNATPTDVLVALGLPNNISVEGIETFYQGVAEAAAHYEIAVAGGDTVAANRLTVSVTALGNAKEDTIVTRAGAQPGDLLCATGDLGASAAGLKILLSGKDRMESRSDQEDGQDAEPDIDLIEWSYVVERHLYPQARLDRIQHWAEKDFQPHALIDISDGLAGDVHHLCREGIVGATIEAGWLPIHLQTVKAAQKFGETPESLALYGGEDYELLFAAPKERLEALDSDTFAVVGTVTEPEEGVQLRLADDSLVPLSSGGFSHFKTP